MRVIFLTGMAMAAVVLTTSASAAEYVVGQKDKTFVMNGKKVDKVAIKAGDTIRFANEDPFFHNIFSLSDLKTFDLGSFPKGDSRTVHFDKSGTVDVECAIHPTMQLKVEVK